MLYIIKLIGKTITPMTKQHQENIEYIAEELLLDFSQKDAETTENFLLAVEHYVGEGYSTSYAIDFALDDLKLTAPALW